MKHPKWIMQNGMKGKAVPIYSLWEWESVHETTATSRIFKCIGHMADGVSIGLPRPIQGIIRSNEERNKCSSRCRRQFYKTCRQKRTSGQQRIFVRPVALLLMHHLLCDRFNLIWFYPFFCVFCFYFSATVAAADNVTSCDSNECRIDLMQFCCFTLEAPRTWYYVEQKNMLSY